MRNENQELPGFLQPIIPLIPEHETDSSKKNTYITMEVKCTAGSSKNSKDKNYKKHILRFEAGTPQEWINLKKDLEEVWKQNSIEQALDRCSTSLEELNDAIKTTALSIFPSLALSNHKRWME